MTKPWDATSEHLLRELAPLVLGAVARRFRDFSSAEDAVQEAMIAAFTQWPQEGVPENPRGWLIQVASRRMTDQVRSEIARRERETAVGREADIVVPTVEIASQPFTGIKGIRSNVAIIAVVDVNMRPHVLSFFIHPDA